MAINTREKITATPVARAKQIKKKFEFLEDNGDLIHKKDLKKCSLKFQKGIIKILKDYGIHSEYENQVLIELKKLL